MDVVLAVDDGDFIFPSFGIEIGCVSSAPFERGTANFASASCCRGFGLCHLGNHVVECHVGHEAVDSIFNRIAFQSDVTVVLFAWNDAERFREESRFANDNTLTFFGAGEAKGSLFV